MKNTIYRNRKRVGAVAATVLLVLSLSACKTEEDKARDALQSQKATGDTLEKKNLAAKKDREEDPNAVRYVYLYTFGDPMGYYVTKGKISSSGSQRTPEQDIHYTCSSGGNCTHVVVDGAKDDGSYGQGDPGIFFFLADGTMIETSFDYLIADKPIQAVNVPLLGQ